jgi:hypothetical protein
MVALLLFVLYDDKIATCKQSKGYQATTKNLRYIQCSQRTIVNHQEHAVQAKGTIADHRNAVQAKGQC